MPEPEQHSLEELKQRLREFAEARDWDQFHSPKNLAMALIAEAAELVENLMYTDVRTINLARKLTYRANKTNLLARYC